MLVLTRRLNEKILLPNIQTSIQVVALKAGVVRLGIDAPPEVVVVREEVQNRQAEWGGSDPLSQSKTAEAKLNQLNTLLRNRLKVTDSGLALLRHQLEAGLSEQAEQTLAQVEDDLRSLQQRFGVEAEKPAPRPTGKVRKALLVEDDNNERELLASFLRLGGMEVDTAADGTDALDYLRARGRPDVVLLDMGMPRCDGPTAVRAIRRNPALKGLKIFAVTGHLPEEFDLGEGPAGIDRWFHKPLDPTLLLRDLENDLENTWSRVC